VLITLPVVLIPKSAAVGVPPAAVWMVSTACRSLDGVYFDDTSHYPAISITVIVDTDVLPESPFLFTYNVELLKELS